MEVIQILAFQKINILIHIQVSIQVQRSSFLMLKEKTFCVGFQTFYYITTICSISAYIHFGVRIRYIVVSFSDCSDSKKEEKLEIFSVPQIELIT